MPRGGLRVDDEGTTNHLFKPKWNNKKTVAIRIPRAFKQVIMSLVRGLDEYEITANNGLVAVAIMRFGSQLNKELDLMTKSTKNPNELAEDIYQKISTQNNQNKQINSQNKYQLAVECFGEFVESQKLNMEDLSKSRKGTKKHQLYEINQWLIEKSNSSK